MRCAGNRSNDVRDNLLYMVHTAQAAGARVLLLGMRIPPNYGPEYTKKFQALFREVAQQTKGRIRAVFVRRLRRRA